MNSPVGPATRGHAPQHACIVPVWQAPRPALRVVSQAEVYGCAAEGAHSSCPWTVRGASTQLTCRGCGRAKHAGARARMHERKRGRRTASRMTAAAVKGRAAIMASRVHCCLELCPTAGRACLRASVAGTRAHSARAAAGEWCTRGVRFRQREGGRPTGSGVCDDNPASAECATPSRQQSRLHAMSGNRPPWVGAEDERSVSDHLRQEYAARGEPTATLRVAADSVEAYLEYERVVGGADGGVLLTDEEYAAFRQSALERSERRLYVTWRNASGLDCKCVGPATLCECGHRYKEHTRLDGHGQELRCRAAGCLCASFQYLPSAGAWHAKCGCKHGAVRDSALALAVRREGTDS